MLCRPTMRGDSCDIASGASADINSNSQPDECEPVFKRADVNCDSKVDLADGVFVFNFLFRGGPRPCCADAADSNDDGSVDISDGIFSLNWLFQGGVDPNPPGPFTCGIDPTNDDLVERFGDCLYPKERCPQGE